jgi:NAD(P)-dependent dehydrogenase (short-subunit alcohol dehydrogenase family)
MSRFAGKVALVAGAETAIGAAVAAAFRAEGATVIAPRSDLDLTTVTAWEQLLAEVATHGRLDVLITYAAAAYPQPMAIADTSLAAFRAVVRPNIAGAFLAMRYGLLQMRAYGQGGAVITIAPAAATIGMAQQGAANASANAIRMMTKSAALACAEAKDGIRVNGLLVGALPGAVSAGPVPLPHTGRAEDAAAAALFLASDDASYITGYLLPVDGGLLAA